MSLYTLKLINKEKEEFTLKDIRGSIDPFEGRTINVKDSFISYFVGKKDFDYFLNRVYEIIHIEIDISYNPIKPELQDYVRVTAVEKE